MLQAPQFPQEAYYWLYSEHPALSYFDHPPMVAWLIRLGTTALGDSIPGVRLFTWICALVVTASGWGLLREFGTSARVQLAWILTALAVPIFAVGHFYTTPDAPLVACWSVALFALWKARKNGSLLWWTFAGAAAGGALLSKYTACFLGLGGILVLLFDPMMRKQLFKPGPWLGLVLALAVFSPVILWNYENGWVSFRFQTENRYAEHGFTLRWIGQLLIGQFFLLHPVIALMIPAGLLYALRSWRKDKDPRALWLMAFSVPMLLVMGSSAFFTHVKGNWMAPAYPLLVMFALMWGEARLLAKPSPRVEKFAQGSLMLVVAGMLFVPVIDVIPIPFGNNWSGWSEISLLAEACEEELDHQNAEEGDIFFFGLHYRESAPLWFHLMPTLMAEASSEYGEGESEEPVLAQNVLGRDALQFDFWTPPEELIGMDAVYVMPEPGKNEKWLPKVEAHFERIVLWRGVEVRRMGIVVRRVNIYTCYNYLGPDLQAQPQALIAR